MQHPAVAAHRAIFGQQGRAAIAEPATGRGRRPAAVVGGAHQSSHGVGAERRGAAVEVYQIIVLVIAVAIDPVAAQIAPRVIGRAVGARRGQPVLAVDRIGLAAGDNSLVHLNP